MENEPYITLLNQLKSFKGSYKDACIVINYPNDINATFINGFYIGCEDDIKQVPKIKLILAEMNDKDNKCFIRCILTNGFSRDNYYDMIFDRIHDISLRLPYIYIPDADSFEAECTLSDKISVTMDAIVSDKDKVEQVCCLMLSHMIMLFALDD